MNKIETCSCSQAHLVREGELMMRGHIDSLSCSDLGNKQTLELVFIVNAMDSKSGHNVFSDANRPGLKGVMFFESPLRTCVKGCYMDLVSNNSLGIW